MGALVIKKLRAKAERRWNNPDCNVRSDQSLDDNVVSHRVMVVADHPNVILFGNNVQRRTT